jgi:hypothetical protein
MLVTGKMRCIACPAVLINLKVSGPVEIRNKLRLLVRGHLDEKVSLLELDCSPVQDITNCHFIVELFKVDTK